MYRFASTVAVTAVISLAPITLNAQEDAGAEALFDILGMPEMIGIMRLEGLAYGETLAEDMLPDGATSQWNDAISAIYDEDQMLEQVRGAFTQALEGDDVAAMIDYYTGEPGSTIVELEVSARRALLDEVVEAASIEAAAIQMMDETPRYQMITEFITANDLIESNVAGGLNSSYAFYMGMIDGGAAPAGVTADTALQDVWAQEADIRASTTEWAYSFLLMAYQPLSDDELESYIVFSQTDAGKDLTAALFAAFDDVFNDISRELGLTSSRFMATQEL